MPNIIKRQYPKYISSPLDCRVLFQPDQFFKETLTPTAYKIMDQLFHWAHKYDMIFPAQETIALAIGSKRETVCRLMKELVDYGLVVKVFKRKTWCYALAAWFKSIKARRRLSMLFPILAIGLPIITKENFKNEANVTLTTRNNIELRVTRFSNFANNVFITNETKNENNITRARTYEIEKSAPKPKERVLSTEATISPVIDRLSFLTLAGKIEVAAYPDSIVQLASDNIVKMASPNNPFTYFLYLCKMYATQRGISADYGRVNALQAEYGIERNVERNIPGEYTRFYEEAKVKKAKKNVVSGCKTPYSREIDPENKEMITNHFAKHQNRPLQTKLTAEIEAMKFKPAMPVVDKKESREHVEANFRTWFNKPNHEKYPPFLGKEVQDAMWTKFLSDVGSSPSEALKFDKRYDFLN